MPEPPLAPTKITPRTVALAQPISAALLGDCRNAQGPTVYGMGPHTASATHNLACVSE